MESLILNLNKNTKILYCLLFLNAVFIVFVPQLHFLYSLNTGLSFFGFVLFLT